MFDFVEMIADLWKRIFSLFEQYSFDVSGYKVSYFTLIFGFLVIAFVISYFWKGARA